jgi:hypothetical protein
MNSKQRRARIRAGMPNVLRRITTMKLIGDMAPQDADRYIAALQSPYLKLRDFEAIVRTVAVAERDVELRDVFKDSAAKRASTPTSGTAYTIIIDEATQIK